MSFIDVPLGSSASNSIEVPRIALVDKFAVESTGEFVEAWQQVFDDPSGLLVRPYDSAYVENHVASAADQEVTLKAGAFLQPKTEADTVPIASVLQAVVVDKNDAIDMQFSIEQRNLRYYNVDKDPFTSMILDYFKAHLEARRSSIARSALIPQARTE